MNAAEVIRGEVWNVGLHTIRLHADVLSYYGAEFGFNVCYGKISL